MLAGLLITAPIALASLDWQPGSIRVAFAMVTIFTAGVMWLRDELAGD
jgi:hypothetical protein